MRATVGLLTGLVLALLATAPAGAGSMLRLAGGPSGGVYLGVASSLCRLLAPEPCSALETEGSAGNLGLLQADKADFALVQSDVLFDAAATQAVTPVGGGRALRAVLSLYAEPLSVLVRHGDPALRFVDLRGRRLASDGQGSGTRDTLQQLIAALNWDGGARPSLSRLRQDEQAKALCGGTVDALALVIGHPSRRVEELLRACPLRLLSVDGPPIDTFLLGYPFYGRVTIRAGTYPNLTQDVPTVGSSAILTTRIDMPAERVRRLLDAVDAGFDRLAADNPALLATGVPPAERALVPIRLHVAAEAFWTGRR